jgi:hypothetical protein
LIRDKENHDGVKKVKFKDLEKAGSKAKDRRKIDYHCNLPKVAFR